MQIENFVFVFGLRFVFWAKLCSWVPVLSVHVNLNLLLETIEASLYHGTCRKVKCIRELYHAGKLHPIQGVSKVRSDCKFYFEKSN